MVVLTFDWRRNGPYTHQASTEEGMGIVVVLAARLHCHILALEESPLTLEESNSLQQKEEFSNQKKNPIASNRKKGRIHHPRNRKEEESKYLEYDGTCMSPHPPCHFLNIEERVCSHAERW
jgi:hypothetical protein